MPARHKHKSRLAVRRNPKHKFNLGKLLFLLPVLGILIVGLIVFLISFGSIGSLKRVSLATQDSDGNVTFSLFDFESGSVSNIVVGADTQVTVARSLGNWKMGVVGKLGENEKVGGVLLAETVTKALRMPTYYWGDEVYEGLGSGNFSATFKAIFSFESTNLKFADRVKIGFFSLGVKSNDRKTVVLSETKYLTRSKLEDGSLGYKVKDSDLPFELKAILADGDISKEAATIVLENGSGKDSVSAEFGKLVSIMGGKVSSISKMDVTDTLCSVHGDSKLLTYQAIVKTFGCKKEGKIAEYNFDIVVRVGKQFALRF